MWEVYGIGRCVCSIGIVFFVKWKLVMVLSVEGSSWFLCCMEMLDFLYCW